VPWLFYLKLIGYTAGTLVYLFLIVLILGHRRPRKLERLLFLLALELFLVYSGGLLEINAQIQYGSIPPATILLYLAISALGMVFLPALLVHSHLQYFCMARQRAMPRFSMACIWLLYAAPFIEAWMRGLTVHGLSWPNFLLMLTMFGTGGTDILIFGVLACVWIDWMIWESSKDPIESRFFKLLCTISVLIVVPLALRSGFAANSRLQGMATETAIVVPCVLPGTLFIYFALRHKFLEFGAQQNLVYALSASSLALLYLALVRRVSGWLEPVLPPEATASILLFALIFLFEPLERAIGPILHRRLAERMARVQRLTAELQQEARQGNVAQLIAFAERRIREEFGLAAVRISVPRDASAKPLESPGGLGHTVQVPLRKDGKEIGLLEAASTGSFLTGETSAALEFIGEQFPAMLDLCRLIEEKVRRERELAERERLALLGQMAASVSHNLRNPLSSMKTILQVQLEHPNLPLDVRHDCALVVGEIDRMGEKLRQLLNFAKPSVNGQSVPAVSLARQTAALFARDAERRNLRLEFDGPMEEISVLASEDALGEVLSNLIVNAIEAQPNGGRVRVRLSLVDKAHDGARLEIRVEDDGPGISQEIRARIFQPYFTTKATGTGLGLSIVVRRVDEMGGTISCESPVRGGKGTRFRLTIPLATEKGRGADANDSPGG
jgi:signal transduction histidine kinase